MRLVSVSFSCKDSTGGLFNKRLPTGSFLFVFEARIEKVECEGGDETYTPLFARPRARVGSVEVCVALGGCRRFPGHQMAIQTVP